MRVSIRVISFCVCCVCTTPVITNILGTESLIISTDRNCFGCNPLADIDYILVLLAVVHSGGGVKESPNISRGILTPRRLVDLSVSSAIVYTSV